MTTKNLLLYFMGSWQISRKLGSYGTAQGHATFSILDQKTLLYQEQVVVRLTCAAPLQAHKEYIYQCDERGALRKFFSKSGTKSALFYRLIPLSFCQATGLHYCKNDTYAAFYRFYSEKMFDLHYQVRGPRKDYAIATVFNQC